MTGKAVRACQRALYKIGQFAIRENNIQKLFTGQGKGKIIFTLTVLRGLAFTTATAAATLRPLELVTCDEILVAGVNYVINAAFAVMENRLGNIAPGNCDVNVAIVSNTTTAQSVIGRSLICFL